MNEQRGEALSALLDGELGGEERGLLLDRLESDHDLRDRWTRYALIGDVLRGEATAAGDLAARVGAAVESEPTALAPRGDSPEKPAGSVRDWLRPVGGLALAASLATVAVLGGQTLDRGRQSPAVTVAQQSAERAVRAADASDPSRGMTSRPAADFAGGEPGYTAERKLRWSAQQRGVQERLNAYLVDYSGHLGGDLRGMLPYARVVGYDGKQR